MIEIIKMLVRSVAVALLAPLVMVVMGVAGMVVVPILILVCLAICPVATVRWAFSQDGETWRESFAACWRL